MVQDARSRKLEKIRQNRVKSSLSVRSGVSLKSTASWKSGGSIRDCSSIDSKVLTKSGEIECLPQIISSTDEFPLYNRGTGDDKLELETQAQEVEWQKNRIQPFTGESSSYYRGNDKLKLEKRARRLTRTNWKDLPPIPFRDQSKLVAKRKHKLAPLSSDLPSKKLPHLKKHTIGSSEHLGYHKLSLPGELKRHTLGDINSLIKNEQLQKTASSLHLLAEHMSRNLGDLQDQILSQSVLKEEEQKERDN